MANFIKFYQIYSTNFQNDMIVFRNIMTTTWIHTI